MRQISHKIPQVWMLSHQKISPAQTQPRQFRDSVISILINSLEVNKLKNNKSKTKSCGVALLKQVPHAITAHVHPPKAMALAILALYVVQDLLTITISP